MSKQRLYFDHASTAPVLPEVKEAMLPYLSDSFGNAGSLHSFGQEAVIALDRSREIIAKSLGANFRQIIFTSSATEANNLALKGVFERSELDNPRILVSAIEHESVLESALSLKKRGAEIIILPVDKNGILKKEALFEFLNDRTILVSIMHGNNETGSIQPIKDFARIVKAYNKKIIFHTDAVQTFPFLEINPDDMGVDLLTISSHKAYGPKGAAALYVADPSTVSAQTNGGGQEFGLRSGTENTPAIVGFAKAVEVLSPDKEGNRKRLRDLTFYFYESMRDFAEVEINGPYFKGDRLPHILNVYFHGKKNEELLTEMDIEGLAASAGSACSSRAIEKSHVLKAMGFDDHRINGSVRFSLGIKTSKEDVDSALNIIKKVL